MNPFRSFDLGRISGRKALFAAFAVFAIVAAAFAGVSMIGEDSDAATCSTCNGTGKVTCSICSGNGYIQSFDPNEVHTGCSNCGGSGEELFDEGGDVLDDSTYTIGSGKVTCTTCSGTGSVSSGSSGSTEPSINFTSPAAVDSISGSTITYQAKTNITGTTFSATGSGNASWLTLTSAGLLSGTAPSVASKTTATFSILATSPGGQTATQKVTFDVYPVAQLSASSTSVTGKVGTAITPVSITSNLACSYSTTNVSGSLSALGLSFDASTGKISGNPTATGTATVKVIGTTTAGPSQSPSIEISFTINETDLAITSEPPTGSYGPLKNWTYNATANQSVTWSLVGAPDWLAVDNNGKVSGSIGQSAAGTIVTFQLKATTAGGQTATQNISISVESELEFTSAPTAACSVTPLYNYNPDGTYTQSKIILNSKAAVFDDLVPMTLGSLMTLGDSVSEAAINYTAPDAIDAITGSKFTYNASTNITGTTFSKVSGADWLSITSAGVVSGQAPAVTEKTDYQIVIKATSPKGQTIEQTVTITVYPVAKLTASALSTSVHQNSTMNPITVTSNVGVTWSKAGDLPAGVTFADGVLSGAPSVQGTFEITVYGTTIEGPSQTASVKVKIVVGEPVIQITSTGPATLFIVGNTYSYAPTTNVPGSTFTISGAPAWLGVSGGVVTGQVTGYTDGTTITYTLTATSPEAQIATQNVTIVIEPVIAWTSIPTASCIVQATYTYADDGSYTQNVLNARVAVVDDLVPSDEMILTLGAPMGFRLAVVADDLEPLVLQDDAEVTVSPTPGTNADITETGTRTFRFLWTGEDAEKVTWDFGDGTTGEGFQIVHTYEQNGTYTYTCTGTNPVGSSSVSGKIIVDVDDEDDGISIYLVGGLVLLIVILGAAYFHHKNSSRSGSRRSR